MIRLPKWEKGRSSMFGSYDVISQEDVVVNDRIVKKNVIKSVVPSEFHSGLKASDFYMENILAAGAVDMLKPTALHDGGLDAVDSLDINVENLMAAVDNSMPVKNNEE